MAPTLDTLPDEVLLDSLAPLLSVQQLLAMAQANHHLQAVFGECAAPSISRARLADWAADFLSSLQQHSLETTYQGGLQRASVGDGEGGWVEGALWPTEASCSSTLARLPALVAILLTTPSVLPTHRRSTSGGTYFILAFLRRL